MNFLRNIFIVTLSLSTIILTSCNDNDSVEKGSAQVDVTDAAVDAENITGVYLSVSEIHAGSDGEVKTLVTFDEPITFNVMDYQNGETFDLGEGEIEVGIYDELRLILNDGSPSSASASSYIEFENGTTEELVIPSGTSSGYKVKGDFQISANNESNLVIDIDLRKALVITGTEDYMLRPTARLVVNESLSVISGSVTNFTPDANTKWVVYAYAEGTYDESETNEPITGDTRFENSINSAVVSDDGTYKLSFMEEGEYELIVAKYEMNETESSFDFVTTVEVDMMLGLNILNLVTLESGGNVNIDLAIVN